MDSQIPKIVSGGQTGADRAALDWALSRGIECGGWCPKGRKAEEGPIPSKYPLVETPSSNYVQRTEWNVRDTDGTVIISIAEILSGGSKKTLEFAQKHIECGARQIEVRFRNHNPDGHPVGRVVTKKIAVTPLDANYSIRDTVVDVNTSIFLVHWAPVEA